MKSPANSLSIVLDLETFDTGPHSIIYAAGFCAFRRKDFAPMAEIELTPCFYEQLARGRTFSADTIAFHRSKGTLPIIKPDCPSILDTACQIREFFLQFPPAHVWIQGPDFDRPIIESFLNLAFNTPAGASAMPWRHWITKDARTTWDNAFPGVKHPPRPHRALDDCRATLTDIAASFKKSRLPWSAA